MTVRVERGPGWELRLGDYREVLADVEASAVIADPPYSDRTHAGHDQAAGTAGHRRELSYASWSAEEAAALVSGWSERAGWIVAMSDHVLVPDYERAARDSGRYAFAPIPWYAPGSRVRIQGDGPACWAVWLNVSRPRREPWSRWGALPGGYSYTSDRAGHIGGKPMGLMRALVRDYSRRGHLVCDPCAGGGTTLLAAVTEGRRAIGAEVDPATFEMAVRRLRGGYTPTLPGLESSSTGEVS